MPVDEALIDAKIQQLNEKMIGLNRTRNGIRSTIEKLHNLKQIEETVNEDDEEQNPVTRKIKHNPNDPGTGQEMSNARRQEVYNAQMSEADSLLA